MDVTQVALEGLNKAQQMLEAAGGRLARIPEAATRTGADVDSVDLSAETVAVLQARNLFETNLGVMKTADEMTKSAIDMLG